MKDSLYLPITMRSIAKDDTAQEGYLKLEVPAAQLEHWCLSLCLLENGILKSLQIDGGKDRPHVSFTVSDKDKRRGVFRKTSDGYTITLPRTELEMWITFFLRTYYYDVADVDHIDAEFYQSDGKTLNLVLMFRGAVRPPLSPDELKKLLQ